MFVAVPLVAVGVPGMAVIAGRWRAGVDVATAEDRRRGDDEKREE
jgi:hypothetical protein